MALIEGEAVVVREDDPPAALPPGQHERADFPRFGLPQFARRFPARPYDIAIDIVGELEPFTLDADTWHSLPRTERTADFHCVTTWSRRALRWGGVRFAELFADCVRPRLRGAAMPGFVVLRGQDGFRQGMLLEDLLGEDVLVADWLDGAPLDIAHGAPLRLVAPAHYGYKSVKHLQRIEFHPDARGFRPHRFAFMHHLRARVALEERASGVPGWLMRALYRPLAGSIARRFAGALAEREGTRRPPPRQDSALKSGRARRPTPAQRARSAG